MCMYVFRVTILIAGDQLGESVDAFSYYRMGSLTIECVLLL